MVTSIVGQIVTLGKEFSSEHPYVFSNSLHQNSQPILCNALNGNMLTTNTFDNEQLLHFCLKSSLCECAMPPAHQCTEDTLALCDGGHLLPRELSKAQLT